MRPKAPKAPHSPLQGAPWLLQSTVGPSRASMIPEGIQLIKKKRLLRLSSFLSSSRSSSSSSRSRRTAAPTFKPPVRFSGADITQQAICCSRRGVVGGFRQQSQAALFDGERALTPLGVRRPSTLDFPQRPACRGSPGRFGLDRSPEPKGRAFEEKRNPVSSRATLVAVS
ncbi:MAG: hypothetical protein BJ554DRAFT_6507 [Olpidium bornovanus]|uniref:Uncharacterized protein n=1 Tax=Olpidium bornovanus TaxID=278681 RepID=A0A8H8DKM8_9FUNG|nr:MAG: hypothetical protein BJ554DRAFT_6507 [Olpidium bornovanus]